jgi:hypothetical protein
MIFISPLSIASIIAQRSSGSLCLSSLVYLPPSELDVEPS